MSYKMATLSTRAPGPMVDKTLPRLMVGSDGTIAYASEGFEQLMHSGPYALEQSYIYDIITFIHPEQSMNDHPVGVLLGAHGAGAWVAAIRAGVHPVYLRGRGEHIFMFQFDWIQGAFDHRYLMMTLSDEAYEGPQDPLLYTRPSSFSLEGQIAANHETEDFADLSLWAALPKLSSAKVLRAAFRQAEPPNVQIVYAVSPFEDMIGDLMIEMNADGIVLRANAVFQQKTKLSSLSPQEVCILDLIPAASREQVSNMIKDIILLEPREPAIVHTSFQFEGYPPLPVEMRLSGKNNKVYMVARDITDLLRKDAALDHQKQRLQEAESIAHMGYWRWKAGADALEWSDELFHIFGQDPQTFIPTIESVSALLNRTDKARMIQMFQRAMIEQNSYEMDFRLKQPNGDIRYIRCEGRCEQDHEGDVVALYGIMQDMTNQTRVERELRDAKESAERAYASKSKFLANMSHELRTPLNAIIGFSEMMQRQLLGPLGNPRYTDYVAGIRESGEHLMDLISDILDMSKIEAGKYQLSPEDLNLSKLARLAIHMVEGRARAENLSLVTDIPDTDIRITADRRSILQMMLNLLSNAIKFTPEKGRVSLALRCDTDTGRITITVSDTGIGIPADKLAIITRPFEQVANEYTRSHAGSGLGLAITKELCLMHAGQMNIQSAEGAGTTVTLTLPTAG